MACTLIDVRPVNSCGENYAGTGNKAYIARLNTEQRSNIIVSDSIPTAVLAFADFGPEFHEIVLKSKVNKIDFQSNPNGGGYTATANLVVDKQVDSWARNSRILNNTGDWIVLLSTGKANEYYLLGDANYDNEFSDAATTGDAPDSEKGSTITITAGPLKWPYLKVNGILVPSADEDFYSFGSTDHTGNVSNKVYKSTVDLSDARKPGTYVVNGVNSYIWDKEGFGHYVVPVEPGDDVCIHVNKNHSGVNVKFLKSYDVNNDSIMNNVLSASDVRESDSGEYVAIAEAPSLAKYAIVFTPTEASFEGITKIELAS